VKVTAFLGSPRKNGNTDTLTARLLRGAEEAGHVTETVALRRLTIKPCLGCEQCWKKGHPCIMDDDMLPLYQTIADSDVLVFATPVYWYAPTALMKAFIDRLVPFNRPQGRPLIQGKGAILVVAYEEEGPEAAGPLVRMFELSFRYLGLRFLHRLVIDRLGTKGAVLGRPEALESAYEAGRGLG
jgi:multimeric flavodoxin WrbA